jgi:AraC-like DNA-binding protein
MLTQTVLIAEPGLRVAAVSCSGPARWSAEEEVEASAVVLVRRGVFARRADGRPGVADPVQGYVQRPGEVQQVAHPAGPDRCTSISIAPDLADRLAWAGPLTVSPAADLAHRRLVSGAVSAAELTDLAADLIAQLLPPPARRLSHRAVDDVRIALQTDPGADLDDLAALAGCSRWHLSRTFHQVTGLTITGYRLRLRTRAVLAELADSSDGLAGLAARAGFADQAHLSRTIRRELGRPPGEIRKLLITPDGGITLSRGGMGPTPGYERGGLEVRAVLRPGKFTTDLVTNEGPGAVSAGAQGLRVNTPSTDRNVGLSYPHRLGVRASGVRIA